MSKILKPAIFGMFDGLTSSLGVILALLAAPHALLLAALGVGVSGTVGMAAGEYLSESDNGFLASVVMGLATGLGVLLPILPFMFLSGVVPLILSILITISTVAFISKLRVTETKSYKRAALESFSILLVVGLSVWLGLHS